MKHLFAYTENELPAPPPDPNDPFTPKQRRIAIGILIFAALVLVLIYAWHNGWLSQPTPKLKQIRTEKQSVSAKIDSVVTEIKEKAKTSVKTQQTLNKQYKYAVPVVVVSDSLIEAFYLRDSIIKYD